MHAMRSVQCLLQGKQRAKLATLNSVDFAGKLADWILNASQRRQLTGDSADKGLQITWDGNAMYFTL